mgnify:CR=1 FL=1
MTIRHETVRSSVYAAKVFCTDCNRHLAVIHNGYGEDAEPVDRSDMDSLDDIAEHHDDVTMGLHDVVVYTFIK